MIRPDRVVQLFPDEGYFVEVCQVCDVERRQMMNNGMLWYDNDPKTALTVKIEKAVDYYRHKYGRDPNLCLIHPSMLPADEKVEAPAQNSGAGDNPRIGKITVRPYRPVLPGHLWIGVEDKH